MKSGRKRDVLASFEELCAFLVSKGIITAEQRQEIIPHHKQYYKRLEKINRVKADGAASPGLVARVTPLDVLISMNIKSALGGEPLTEDMVMKAVAEDMGLPFIKIDPLKLDLDVVTSTIPKAFALRHLMIPVSLTGRQLKVATANPYDIVAMEDIKRVNDLDLVPVVSTKSDILKTIREFFGFKSSIVQAEKEISNSFAIDLGNLEQLVRLKDFTEIQSTDHHIKNAVDYLFHYALDQRASDIHIEPKRDETLVRLRIDGVLHNVHALPKLIHSALVSRIKSLARMDIAEKRRPQDGRIKISYEDREVELRVSTVPVAFGEKVVIRLLDPTTLFRGLEELGFSPQDLITYHRIVSKPHGIVLVTGPTGSGKTTTLYSTLKFVETPEKNIVTIEDPIEMICENFNQIAVQPQAGITFASILRSVLRQDPDIIMVGEIRDLETAQNAIQAALTGHLVLSTLHTNDAPSAIIRLMDLGIEPYLINSTLNGVVAQRLVRKICSFCSESFILSRDELKELGIDVGDSGSREFDLRRGKGCPRCRMTGYLGRKGVFEVFEVTPDIRRIVRAGVTSDEIKAAVISAGMTTLRENAVDKMMKGVTTLQEVLRVTAST